MFSEALVESSPETKDRATKVRRFLSVAAGFLAMIMMAAVLAIVPVVRASAVSPPAPPSLPAPPPIAKQTVIVAPRMKRVLLPGTVTPAIHAPVYYRPRSL